MLALHVSRAYKESDEARMPAGASARFRASTAHIITRQDTTVKIQPSSRIVTVAAFLLEAGVDPNVQDVDGMTASRFAVETKHLDLAAVLVRKGVDISKKAKDGKSALDLLENAADMELVCSMGRVGLSELPKLLPKPIKVSGCTYLSFSFEKLSAKDLGLDEDPYLKISVYARAQTANREDAMIAETPQAISLPIVNCDEYLYWGSTWHMQAALEDIHHGFAVAELCHKKTNETVAWGHMSLDLNDVNVNTGERRFEMFEGGVVDLSLTKEHDTFVSGDIFMSGELTLSKKE